jgi:hypothetical protein
MSRSEQILISKLDAFIRKFYKNELLKGAILAFAAALMWFLSITFLEYLGNFSTGIRLLLFVLLVSGVATILAFYILKPLLKLFSFGKVISHHQAAIIIGNHFPDVKDKLLNTLQLQQQNTTLLPGSLLEASIEQRTRELTPLPFQSVIRFSDNRRWLKFAAIPVTVIGAILLINAGMLTDPAGRIVNYHEEYIPEAPFQFELQNENLQVLEMQPIQISVKAKGENIPSEMMIEYSGKRFKMKNMGKGVFTFDLTPRLTQNFRFVANGYYSSDYVLSVLPRPSLQQFVIDLDYPAYTGKKNEKVVNNGDLYVPEGTAVKWSISSKNTDKLIIQYGDSSVVLKTGLSSQATFRRIAKYSLSYSIISENKYVRIGDSVLYNIKVIPDQYPIIQVDEKVDSSDDMIRYFMGTAADDYGFNGISFHYRVKSGATNGKLESRGIQANLQFSSTSFNHYFDLHQLNLSPGDVVEYFFSVSDNDRVNGSKTTSSQTKIYKVPTEEELKKQHQLTNEASRNNMNEMLKEVQDFRKQMDEFRKNVQSSSKPDWRQQQKLNELMMEQKELQEKMKEMNEQFKNDLEKMKEFEQLSPEMLEKKELLEKLMDELLTDDIKKMMEELQKMLDSYNKEKMNEKLEDFQFNMEDYEKQLDRALEQFKQMEFEEKLQDAMEKLESIKESQEKLNEMTQDKTLNQEQLAKEQDELKEKMEELKDDLKAMDELNKELQNKRDMEGLEDKAEETKQEMQEGSEKISEGKNKKAGEHQKNAEQKMQEMMEQMQGMQQQQQQQNEEDVDALRALLENIIKLSFDQEQVMADMQGLDRHDPRFYEVGKQQRKLRDDAGMIRDSLFALSKRVPQIESFVNKEISIINRSMDKALVLITERQTAMASAEKQTAMTSLNNLALMLAETLDQMQQQMASQMQQPGSGSCTKPGGGSPKQSGSMSMQQMQKQLQQQLEKMKKMMENGQKPGGQKGDKPGENNPGQQGQGNSGNPGQNPGNSEQFAKMAAEQQALRKMIQQMRQELNMDGSGKGNGLQPIEDQLEKNEEELIHKKITNEMLMRQQDILTRLLEHEKAERERGMDEKRESKEGKNEDRGNLEKYFEYNRKKSKELELLRTIPPDLQPYYKRKVSEYFNSVQ